MVAKVSAEVVKTYKLVEFGWFMTLGPLPSADGSHLLVCMPAVDSMS